ncbi:hypothetical protein ScPMuIL_013456 [Solemya velum]
MAGGVCLLHGTARGEEEGFFHARIPASSLPRRHWVDSGCVPSSWVDQPPQQQWSLGCLSPMTFSESCVHQSCLIERYSKMAPLGFLDVQGSTRSFLLCIILLSLACVGQILCDGCVFNGHDFSKLDKFSPWFAVSDNSTLSYQISICKPLPAHVNCGDSTAVCLSDSVKNTSQSVGNFVSPLHFLTTTDEAGVVLMLQGGTCPEQPSEKLSTALTFVCGKTLGSPKFVSEGNCFSTFEWETSIACDDVPVSEAEVPCYTHDSDGAVYDLSPLIKTSGAYLVEPLKADDPDFYINVCRDITADSDTKGCPSDSAACRITGNDKVGWGGPSKPLSLGQGSAKTLILEYSSPHAPAECSENATVQILFNCPPRRESKDPVLTSSWNCRYIIEWQTDYACAATSVTSKTCKLTKESTGVDFDLTPLKKVSGEHQHYVVLDGNFKYFINVCGPAGVECPDDSDKNSIGVCQTMLNDSTYGKAIGRSDKQTLRYADGELVLISSGRDFCQKKKMKSTTVITFHCNKTAGVGSPTFRSTKDCTYMFDWHTQYACLSAGSGECRVTNGKNRYDLSPLSRRSGSNNWRVLHSEADFELQGAEIVLNMCHDLLRVDDSEGCPPDSSICMIKKSGDTSDVKSLGNYKSEPFYNTNRDVIQMNYTMGPKCPSSSQKNIESIITFFCKPGDLESGPTLSRLSEDECVYEIEWHTAAACVLGHTKGTNCRVSDDESGIDFDLSPLTQQGGHYYHLEVDNKYDYYINVCGAVTGTKCDHRDTPNFTGTCQVTTGTDSNQKIAHNCGQPSSELVYFDGIITLTYRNGDSYTMPQGQPPTNRSTEFTFLCDPKAGVGTPLFVSEHDHIYFFNWWTNYACPEASVECVVDDEASQKQYDLSSLSKSGDQENWAVVFQGDDGVQRKLYINVCRSLNPIQLIHGESPCDLSAAVCMTTIKNGEEADESRKNLGEVSSPPTVDDEGGLLSLKYIGPTCSEHGQETHVVTTVKFICKEGDLNMGPSRPLRNEGTDCEYTVLWNTGAACPLINKVESEDKSNNETCTMKDQNSDYVYNFKLLMKDGIDEVYHVSDDKNNTSKPQFLMNICGSLDDKHCGTLEGHDVAVCMVVNGSKSPLAFAAYTIDYVDEHIQIVMEGKRHDGIKDQVTVTFRCDRTKYPGDLKYYNRDGSYHYIFVFHTALACPPEPVDCLVQDRYGYQYDLTPLSRTTTNWQAIDVRPEHSDLRYFINVCRPLNENPCPGGPIGACVVSGGAAVEAHNMGYIHAKPIISDDGTITIHYVNGDICHEGTIHEAPRSTRIIFSCSKVEHEPVFVSESPECEYVFQWNTVAACPIVKSVGEDCKVTHPLYDYEFDLSSMMKTTANYQVTSKSNDRFLINVCSELVSGSGACKGAGACRTDVTPVRNLGEPNKKLTYGNGVLTLQYIDDSVPCTDTVNRTTSLLRFICDESKDVSEAPQYITSPDQCSYVFETLVNKDTTGQHFPPNSAACAVDLKQQGPIKKYQKLGEVGDASIKMEAGKLLLIYRNGDPCNGGKNKTSTYIVFICNQDAIGTHPTGHFKVGECENHFVWSTAAACPITTTSQPTDSKPTNCTVTDPRTGYVYNLASLKSKEGYAVEDHKGHTYKLNVCQMLTTSPCAANTGICQSETDGEGRHFSGGIANDRLQINDGIITLNYTGGDKCHDEKFERNTIISFVCSEGSGTGTPQYIDESGECTYYISWHTDLVCQEKVKCSLDVNNSYTLDLSPLIDRSNNHIALLYDRSTVTSGSTLYLSICRPLSPLTGVLCPPGASACMTKPGQTPLSLGRVSHDHPPFLDPSTNQVVLEYLNGGPCPNNFNKNVTTRIYFHCERGSSHGEPTLQSVDACTFNFVWNTHVVCPVSSKPTPASGCSFYDNNQQMTFNLSFGGPYTIQPKGQNGKSVKIKVCGSVSEDKSSVCSGYWINICNGVQKGPKGCPPIAGACQHKDGHVYMLGRNSKQKLYLTVRPCYYFFLWRTQHVCPPVDNHCVLSSGGHIFDLRALSIDKGSWPIQDGSTRYWINICNGVQKGPKGCPPIAGACQQKDGHVYMLGRNSKQKLYFDMSASETTIVLEYAMGAAACASNGDAKTVIRFVCGHTFGRPVFLSQPPYTCIFNFEWKSTVACAVEPWKNITEVDGVITDTRIGAKFNLSKLYSMGYHTASTERLNDHTYIYAINLNGTNPDCPGSVVCQHNLVDTTYKHIGLFEGRRFYIKDDIVEAVYPTTEKCTANTNYNVQSIIQFVCSPDVQKENPEFSFHSKTCSYHFVWKTRVLCTNHSGETGGINLDSGTTVAQSSTGTHGTAVASVVSIFVVAVVVCLLVIIFHKKERRVSFKIKMKNLIPCTRFTQAFRYTKLTQADEKEEDWLLSGGNDGGTISHGYHDDSDDDMLESL